MSLLLAWLGYLLLPLLLLRPNLHDSKMLLSALVLHTELRLRRSFGLIGQAVAVGFVVVVQIFSLLDAVDSSMDRVKCLVLLFFRLCLVLDKKYTS